MSDLIANNNQITVFLIKNELDKLRANENVKFNWRSDVTSSGSCRVEFTIVVLFFYFSLVFWDIEARSA